MTDYTNEDILHELTAQGFSGFEWQEVRITDLDGTVTKEKLQTFLETYYDTFLVGEETAKNHHFHLAIGYENLENYPKSQYFRDLLYDYFQPPKKGNSFFSSKPVTDVERYFPYTLKDGLFFSSKNMESLSTIIYDLSFEKPLGYKKDLQKLYNRFQEGQILNRELWTSIAHCRAHYDLSFNARNINELVNSQLIKKHPELAEAQFQKNKQHLLI